MPAVRMETGLKSHSLDAARPSGRADGAVLHRLCLRRRRGGRVAVGCRQLGAADLIGRAERHLCANGPALGGSDGHGRGRGRRDGGVLGAVVDERCVGVDVCRDGDVVGGRGDDLPLPEISCCAFECMRRARVFVPFGPVSEGGVVLVDGAQRLLQLIDKVGELVAWVGRAGSGRAGADEEREGHEGEHCGEWE